MLPTGVGAIPTKESTEDSGAPSTPSNLPGLWRKRLVGSLIFFCLIWPLLANLFAFLALKGDPLFRGVPLWVVGLALGAGTLELTVQIVVCGVVMAAGSFLVASVVGRRLVWCAYPRRVRVLLLVEPALIAWGLACGIVYEYPGLLLHPLFLMFRSNTVLWASGLAPCAGLLAGILFGRWSRAPGLAWRYPALVLVSVLIGWAGARPIELRKLEAGAGTTVILGLDSISQVEDTGILRDFATRNKGTWYERPVTPGLLTNPVWTSILTGRTVGETGIFFIYQVPDWDRIPDNLVKRARSSGYVTYSYVSDQFTTHFGSMAGFENDRSGPIGWKQEATAFLKNGHIFLPVLLPYLPRLPLGRTPANQSGTFAYSIRGELNEVLCVGRGQRTKTLIAAHNDYLHQPCYPSYSELSGEERGKVLAARAGSLVDHSLDWQYPVEWDEPLGLYEWKLRHLQEVVADCVIGTGFLAPARGNKLLIFSDHGSRTGVLAENFGEEKYHRVILIGFNTEKRDPAAPISLLDIPALIGLPDALRPGPADPVVQYVNVVQGEWAELLQTSRPGMDGTIWLDKKVVVPMGRRLLGFRPYTAEGRYFPVPVTERLERTGP